MLVAPGVAPKGPALEGPGDPTASRIHRASAAPQVPTVMALPGTGHSRPKEKPFSPVDTNIPWTRLHPHRLPESMCWLCW